MSIKSYVYSAIFHRCYSELLKADIKKGPTSLYHVPRLNFDCSVEKYSCIHNRKYNSCYLCFLFHKNKRKEQYIYLSDSFG